VATGLDVGPATDRYRAPPLRRMRGLAGAAWHAGWDVAAGLLVFGVYLAVGAVTATRLDLANEDARQIDAAERWLHMPSELAINQWTDRHPLLAGIANYEYAFGYLATAMIAIVWLRIRRRGSYPSHACRFLAINLVAITVFLLYPVTPPRLLGGAGFADTVAHHATWGSWGSGLISDVANQHAAMPSLHVAWVTWVAIVLVVERAPILLRSAAIGHVGTTTAVIVMTGNHWLLDAVAGLALALTVEGVYRAWRSLSR
jgi:diacylglycerol O-acyltransferase / wax synthase